MSIQSPAAAGIPDGLVPHFHEYDARSLDLDRDANLVIQRALEYGSWDDVSWLFDIYGKKRISVFLRERGERFLSPVAFNYWRKLMDIEQWRASPFPTPRGEVWDR